MSAAKTPAKSRRISFEGLRAMGLSFGQLPRRLSTTDAMRLRRIERLTDTLDTAFRVPGTGFRVGWDSILGLLPVVGDAVPALVSCYIVLEARKMGLPRWAIARMLGNIGLDLAIGTIPLVGDFFDWAFKANVRNLKIVQRELERRHAG